MFFTSESGKNATTVLIIFFSLSFFHAFEIEELCVEIAFDAHGLVPAIIQHARNGQALMLGYMNTEALAQTQASGLVCLLYTSFASKAGENTSRR